MEALDLLVEGKKVRRRVWHTINAQLSADGSMAYVTEIKSGRVLARLTIEDYRATDREEVK